MLNGDVLTDIDLTAQIAQHEATGAVGTLALVPVADPTAYGLVRLNEDQSVKEFVEKPSADQIDTNAHLGRRLRARARGARPHRSPIATSRSSARCGPQLVGDGLFGYAAEALLARHRHARALPAGHLRHPRGQRGDGRGRPPRARLPGGRRPRAGRRAHRAAGARRARLRDRRGRARRLAGRARRGRQRGGGHARSSARWSSTAPRSAPGCVLRDCIVAAGVRIGDGSEISGGAVLGEGVTVGARNVLTRGVRVFPADGPARRRHHVLRKERPILSSTEQLELDRETIGRIDPTDQLTDVLAIPEHLRDALWKVESAGLEPWDSPGRPRRGGHGRLGHRRRTSPARSSATTPRARSSARAPTACRRGRRPTPPCCARPTRATPRRRSPATRRRACIGARRVVVTTGGKLAELARADQVPVVPVRGRLPAAGRGRLHDRRRAAGRRAVRRRAAA